MRFRIEHELPGRLRLRLQLPRYPEVDEAAVEAHFHDIAGLYKVSFSRRTAGVLLRFDGRPATRAALLRCAEGMGPHLPLRPAERSELEKKRRIVMRAGTLFLLRPFIPIPLRPLLAVYGALPVLRRGFNAVAARRFNVDVLDGAAVTAAIATRDFLTVSTITLLLKLGEYLEEWTTGQSRKLLAEMFHTEEEFAWVLRNGAEERIPASEVVCGDTVVVRTGGLIPVDGKVLQGNALVNQSSMTGEPLAVAKRPGISVYAGTAVEEGELQILAEKVGAQTRAARVIHIIEEAERLKSPTQSRGERLADRVVPFTFGLSGFTYLATGDARRAASVLLVDYSCAIKLATPLAIVSSLAQAAQRRVLIKGGRYLEALAEADAIILDKTGTLTEALPEVVEVLPFGNYTRDFILRQAACVEEHFLHPVAHAVVQKAAAEGLSHAEEHAAVEYVVAHGIVSRLHGERILVGSRHFVHEDEKVDVTTADEQVRAFTEKGYSILYVAIGGKLAGIIAIHDPLRGEATEFIRALPGAGFKRVILLTGDNEATAATVAKSLGISEYYARAFPDRKVEIVTQLQQQGFKVAMVGDGINDSPALAQADVGISMRHGADIAKEAADVVLMEGTLHDILAARAIARSGLELIRRNYRTIVGVNTAAILLAITGLTPPLFSAMLHNASTVGVAFNALQPLRRARAAQTPGPERSTPR
ncbi:heavy metal translocating P-type ATPase [Geoalkalibacter halelectricus]|uniref:heavy metal translocating P-type ATPase n=1 Tax=Geoalkalibacter halelectricus TaxID=2847045 RepID=UPI0026706F0B|nr:heavy metal translocating P-type ATPase [Geoalkalibacter halelectricus]MDO3377691.1 heavy metal translocating P-type ATPase [Geoalkalibacter halelectricus]